MKYMLVEIIERAVGIPEIFKSYEDAHRKMCKRFADVCEVSIDEVDAYLQENHDPDGKFDYGTNIRRGAAWTERHGENYDWQILELLDDDTCSYLKEE